MFCMFTYKDTISYYYYYYYIYSVKKTLMRISCSTLKPPETGVVIIYDLGLTRSDKVFLISKMFSLSPLPCREHRLIVGNIILR